MRRDNVNYLLVGGFVLAMFVLLLFVLYRLTGQHAATEPYYAVYRNVSGMRVGTEVTYNGYHVGQVNAIVPEVRQGQTVFKVQLAVRAGWKIPVDSIARATSTGLLSAYLVNIEEGKARTYLKPGGEIRGVDEGNVTNSLRSVTHELQQLSENGLQPLLGKLNHQVDAIGGNLEQQIPRITASTNQLLERLNSTAKHFQTLLNGVQGNHLEVMLNNAQKATQNLLQLSTDLAATNRQFDKLLAGSNAILENNRDDLRQAVVSLRQSLSSVSQNIGTILYNLDVASRNMSEFSRELRANPGVLLRGSPPQDENVTQ